jgi:hypothetical protein
VIVKKKEKEGRGREKRRGGCERGESVWEGECAGRKRGRGEKLGCLGGA